MKEASDDALSDAEIELIHSIFAEFGWMNKWAIVRRLHKTLPEWKDPSGSRIPITYRDILSAEGRDDAEIREIEAELESIASMETCLAGASL